MNDPDVKLDSFPKLCLAPNVLKGLDDDSDANANAY
jgi:hypothetical protein